MAPNTPTKAAGATPTPTASEAMFFFAIVKHTRNKADIDWHAVATEVGFKNAEVAKVRFGQVKRKLGITSNPDGQGTPLSKTPRTPRKRAGSLLETPTKSVKSGKAKTTPLKPAPTPEDTDSDDAEDAVKQEKTEYEGHRIKEESY